MATASRWRFPWKAKPIGKRDGFTITPKLATAMKPLIQQLDHSYLNEIAGLENPTIENMAAWFWKKLEPLCPGLCEIVVHETPTARCVYRGE